MSNRLLASYEYTLRLIHTATATATESNFFFPSRMGYIGSSGSVHTGSCCNGNDNDIASDWVQDPIVMAMATESPCFFTVAMGTKITSAAMFINFCTFHKCRLLSYLCVFSINMNRRQYRWLADRRK